MAHPTVERITIGYRGQTRQFTTVSQAVHFLRREDVITGWFRTITVDVQLVAAGNLRQTQHLRGNKFPLITVLQQLQPDSTRA